MKSWHLVVLFLAVIPQDSALGQNARDIVSMRPTPFDSYAAATHDTLPRLEPYFQAYKEAEEQGDKAQQEAILHQIVLRNTLEEWRWKFYQYGLENEQKLSDRERAAWEMVNARFKGRTTPPNPEEMLRISPETIREALVREKEEFNQVIATFDSGNFKIPKPDPLTPATDMFSESGPLVSASPKTEALETPTSPNRTSTTEVNEILRLFWILLAAIIVGMLLWVLRKNK